MGEEDEILKGESVLPSTVAIIEPPKAPAVTAAKPKPSAWVSANQSGDANGSKLVEVEGITCLIVDKQCMTDEEGMRDLISLLLKNKSKIQGIVITDFEGTFKIDYFKRIELSLREISKLKTIIINNSNLTREHIQILRNIIWWRREQIEKILLNKNSLDSLDFNDLFVQEDFNLTDITNLRQLEIKVQPGINKLTKTQFGEFASLLINKATTYAKQSGGNSGGGGIGGMLASVMNSKSSEKNEKEKLLYISLDETSLNHQNKKIIRQQSDTMSSLHLEDAAVDKQFFSLNLGACFQDRNEAALRYFGEYLLAENFDDIVALSFQKTQLKTIDNWVPLFTFLKKTKSVLDLDLSSCSLSDRIITQLFSQNLAIKNLDLSNNNSIGTMGWKKMTESVICNPKSVTDILKLNNCYFEDAEIKELSRMISAFATRMQKYPWYLCALQKLYLNFNSQITAQGIRIFTSSILSLAKKSIETIEFRDCDFDSEKLHSLLEAIQTAFSGQGSSLDELVLRNNPRLAEAQLGLQNLLIYLMNPSMMLKIRKIDIGNCGVTSTTIETFMDAYSNSSKYLVQIVLKNNPSISTPGYTAIAKHLLFVEDSLVDKLDISNNQLTAEKLSGFLAIAEAFSNNAEQKKRNRQFERLLIKQNSGLEADAFDRLCRYFIFSSSFSIKKVSLKHTLNDAKVGVISKIVKEMKENKGASSLQTMGSLEDIGLDKNNLLSVGSLVDLIEVFLTSNHVFPRLWRVQLSYCNICDTHAKELVQRLVKEQAAAVKPPKQALKALNLTGNTCLTSNGWMMIAYIVFRTGLFEQLELIDLTYCQLEESKVSQICTQFALAMKGKEGTDFKHSLKEIIFNKNYLLESSDWKAILDTFIFASTSQVKKLQIASAGVDSPTMNHTLKENQAGFFENNRLPLIDLNLSGNDAIDDVTWKQFIKVFILNKTDDVELSSEIETLLKNEKEERRHVGIEFNQIVNKYKETITRLSIPHKIPVFTIKELDLRGTTTLEAGRWLELFSKLVLSSNSSLEKLGLGSTFIEKRGWNLIEIAISEFTKNKGPDQRLKVYELDFSDNGYIEQGQWKQISSCLLFNTKLMMLKSLDLSNSKINNAILDTINDGIDLAIDRGCEESQLEYLNLNRNMIESLQKLAHDNLPKLWRLSLDKNNIKFRNHADNKELALSIRSLSIQVNSNDAKANCLHKFQYMFECFPNVKKCNVTGFQPAFALEFPEIIELVFSKNIEHFEFTSQQVKQTDLLDAIVKSNSKMKVFNLTNGYVLSGIEKNENEAKVVEDTLAMERKWESLIGGSVSATRPMLVELDLSNTFGELVQDNYDGLGAIKSLMSYIGRSCVALKKLKLRKFVMSNDAFVVFCQAYKANKQLMLTEINVASNAQITTESWSMFFECVLCNSTKNSLRNVNLGGNPFAVEAIASLVKCAKKMSGKIDIDDFSFDNINNLPATTWTQQFFQGFVMHDSVRIKKLYLEKSLQVESYNGVYQLLSQYVKDSSCVLQNVYGYYDIEQIFYTAFPGYEREINLKNQLEQASQLTVRDLWKKSLVTPNVKRISCDSSLTEDFVIAIPEMTLDFIHDLLVPMNQSIQKPGANIHKTNQISSVSNINLFKTPHILSLDYETIINIQRYFNMTTEDASTAATAAQSQISLAYPYNVILQTRLAEFFASKTNFSHIYFVPHRFYDVIDSRQIYQLFLQLRDTQIDSIIIDYDLRQVDLPAKLSERGLINLIRLFPPRSLELDNVSINALKAIYSILSSNNNFRYSNVNFSSKSFINNGIAFSLREKLFTGKKRRNFIIKTFNSIAYTLLDLFCVEAQVYKFDQSIPLLNEELKNNRLFFNLMIFLTFIYYALCIVVPYTLTRSDGNYEDKKTGINTMSHVIYAIFAVISMLVEIFIYRFAYQKVKHLLPTLINVEYLDKDDRSIWGRIKLFFKNRLQLLEWISYVFSLVISQIDRFDLYSDVCFVVICFKQDFYTIGLISLAVLGSQVGSNLIKLFYLLLRVIRRGSKRLLNTHEINQFCEISNLLEFEGLNDILDTVAPYNISFIPNNFFFRFVMPSAAGQSISNRLFTSMQKFLLEDAIQIVLQIAYVISQNEGDSTIIISIITSIFSIVTIILLLYYIDVASQQKKTKAFYKFMSIRPSTTSQLDFDFLSKQKRSQAEQHRTALTTYRDNMLSNIKIAVESYVPNTNLIIKDSETLYKDEKTPLKQSLDHDDISIQKKL